MALMASLPARVVGTAENTGSNVPYVRTGHPAGMMQRGAATTEEVVQGYPLSTSVRDTACVSTQHTGRTSHSKCVAQRRPG
eukprot:3455503-Rhodomonas_salina.2